MNKDNNITVTVAIPAYNSEKIIKRLVESILIQKEKGFQLKEVIVNSDCSVDKTVEVAQSIKDKRVKVVAPKKRSGFAGTVVRLVKNNDADILFILNDDIIIKDHHFLEKAIMPFLTEAKIGLACCNIQPFISNNFISEAVRSGFSAYQKMSQHIKNGDNVYTCDGKVLAFSKKFTETIKFPKNLSEMGNVDQYIYYCCLNNKLTYKYAHNAIVFFKCPSTMKDFIKWQIRNYKSREFLDNKIFPELSKKEPKIPFIIFTYYRAVAFIKNPIGSMFILILGFYCSYKAARSTEEFKPTWDVVQTTKDL